MYSPCDIKAKVRLLILGQLWSRKTKSGQIVNTYKYLICNRISLSPYLCEVLGLQEHALALEEKKIAVAEKKLTLRKEIEEFETKKVNEILESVASTHFKDGLSETKRNDGKNNLLKFGPKIYEFIKAHGEVDASRNGKSSQVTSNLELANSYLAVHQLEKKS